MIEVQICRCLNSALIFVLSQADLLESVLDIEAEISLGVQMLPPPSDKFSLRLFCFSRDFHQCFRQELEQVVFDRLLAWISCSDRDEAFDQRLQVACFRAPNIRRLPFDFVNRVVCPQCAVLEMACPDGDGIEEACRGRRSKSSFAYCSGDVRLFREVIAS